MSAGPSLVLDMNTAIRIGDVIEAIFSQPIRYFDALITANPTFLITLNDEFHNLPFKLASVLDALSRRYIHGFLRLSSDSPW
jgi:hypothetical protein